MLNESTNAAKYDELLCRIRDESTRDAFHDIVEIAASLADFECYPHRHGYIVDFRFIARDTGKWTFAIVPNQSWLLFYFRPPAVRYGRWSLVDVRTAFPDAKTPQENTWTVKLHNVDDVRQLTALLQLA